jgi:HK97 family phage major capsid protein
MTEVLAPPRPADGDDGDAQRARLDSLRAQYRTLQAQEDRQRALLAELAQLDSIAEPTEDDLAWQGTLIQEHDDLDTLAAPLRKRAADLERVRKAHQNPANREGPDAGSAAPSARSADLATRNFIGADPFAEMDRVRAGLIEPRTVRGWALDAIEQAAKRGDMQQEWAEEATAKTANQFAGQTNVARHILETGSPEYLEAFRAYLHDPSGESKRAALSLTVQGGGFLLPFVLDPSIILTNAGSANPWRRISRVVQTTSNTWNGVNSAGITAAWLAEGTIVTDGTPTLANVVVTPVKAAAWVYGSYEVLEDTDFGQQLPALLADAKDRLEEAAFATGGGTTVPNGVVVGATTVYTTATTTVVALGDVYGVHAALPARFRNAPSAAWVANVANINRIRQLDVAGGSSFWTNLGKGQPETLLGAPIYESTTMSATVASGSLEAIFGDFNQFIICDRVGVSMIYDPLVQGTGGILPTGQAGWFMFWRTGSSLSTVNAFRVMKGV